MKTLKTIYYHITGTPTADENGVNLEENYIKADVYYSEGGYSYFSYKQTPRGYFISARTVGRGKAGEAGYMESYSIINPRGFKQIIGEPVTRQSAKKEREAIAYFEENIDKLLSEQFSSIVFEKET